MEEVGDKMGHHVKLGTGKRTARENKFGRI